MNDNALNLTQEQINELLENMALYRKLGFTEVAALKPSVECILEEVARFYGMDEARLLAAVPDQTVRDASKVAMYLVRRLMNMGFSGIAELFQRDHSTVAYAVCKIEVQLKRGDKLLETDIKSIVACIKEACQ